MPNDATMINESLTPVMGSKLERSEAKKTRVFQENKD